MLESARVERDYGYQIDEYVWHLSTLGSRGNTLKLDAYAVIEKSYVFGLL